jgi:hypothetical protein
MKYGTGLDAWWVIRGKHWYCGFNRRLSMWPLQLRTFYYENWTVHTFGKFYWGMYK